ncbi:MAG: hypothetical protein ABI629_20180 [bacterium]
MPALLLSLLVAAPVALAPAPARGVAATCEAQNAPECGGEAGDATCAANEDCFDTGDGCQCRPRVCCHCENVDGAGLCDQTPCTHTALGSLLLCAAPCLIIDAARDETCNIKLVRGTTCAGGDCPVTGCCAVALQSAAHALNSAVPEQFCAETDQATCDRFTLDDDNYSTSFVPGGACSSIAGECLTPTPSATPTQTATASASPTTTFTLTATATATTTGTATATATKAASGAECTMPDQCATGFCAQGVCCDTACTGPTDSCRQPGERGTCLSLHAPAPPLSRKGLLSVIALLTAVGVMSFSRRRRLSAAATHGAG